MQKEKAQRSPGATGKPLSNLFSDNSISGNKYTFTNTNTQIHVGKYTNTRDHFLNIKLKWKLFQAEAPIPALI